MKVKKYPNTSFLRLFSTYLSRNFYKGGRMNEQPAFLKEKEKYLNMSEEVRQKRFKDDVLSADNIPTWSSYYQIHMERLEKADKKNFNDKFLITKYQANDELNRRISIWRGDITKLHVDAIVNAAKNSLLGGLGVDGAIHKAAGKFLYDECKSLNGCETGNAKVTGGYDLPARYVIHTVGPKGEKPDLLESCYIMSLKRLVEYKLKTIAFPCISTGVYGYPQDSAASVALKTVRKFLETNSTIDRVIFCLFLESDVKIYEAMMQLYFPF